MDKEIAPTSKQRHTTPTREPLAVGYHKTDLFLLVRLSHKNKKQELAIIKGKGDTLFSGKPQQVQLKYATSKDEEIELCSDFKFFCDGEDVTMTYLRTSADGSRVLVYAGTDDRKTWIIGGKVPEAGSPGVLIPELAPHAGDIIYFEGKDAIRAVASKDLIKWNTVLPPRVPQWNFFEGLPFKIIGATAIHEGIVLFFESHIKTDIMTDVGLRDQKVGEERFVKMGAALFSKENPLKLIWQTELPLAEMSVEAQGGKVTFLGVVPPIEKSDIARFYISNADGTMGHFEFPHEVIHDHRKRSPAVLKKSSKNPILEPSTKTWELDGVFNPAALKLGGKVHLLYRAVGNDGWSRIGYASSKDGVHIDERSEFPVYSPHEWFESDGPKKDGSGKAPGPQHDHSIFASGGGWGGCEDPKVTLIGDRIYMTYVAHNGSWPMRTAITSISVNDFLAKKWNWTSSKLMSPPGVGSKSVVILPEKIDGQYVIFHRIWPNIIVDKVPELEFGEGVRWLENKFSIRQRHSHWDSRKLSVGAAPIKTDRGWLVIYGGVDKRDPSRYKMGAMLLDLRNPEKVIARTRKPILSPDEWYENHGKPGIVYPGGAVELDGILHVYYGGADRVSCVATIPLEELLNHLSKDTEPKLTILPVRFAEL